MTAPPCPAAEQLQDYLSGKLPEDDSSGIESHLRNCPACDRAASELDQRSDSLLDVLAGPAPSHNRIFPESNTGQPPTHTTPSMRMEMPTSIASYRFLSQLGQGAMGAVYLARHEQLDKQVAIKLLPPLSAQRSEFVARFQREMRAAGKLEHSAIVRCTDAGEKDGQHYLVMDAVDGLDLSRVVRRMGPLPVADACEIVRQTALGLAYAHSQGVVHRDVKPSNIMLDRSGQVKILDFGLAQVGCWEQESAELTTVGQLMGTLDYMAPEQAEQGGAVNHRADLYSLGATLFRLLTGRAVLAATPDVTPLEKLRLLATSEAPKISTLRRDIPEPLEKLLQQLLSRDPSLRPASASHLAEQLEPFCEQADLRKCIKTAEQKEDLDPPATLARPTIATQSEPSARGGRWNRRLTIGSLLTAALAVAAGVVIILDSGKGQLIIESEVPGVQVRLLQDEKPVSNLTVETGTHVTRLRAGKYEVVLDSESTAVTIDQGEFEIRRGEAVVARVRRAAPTDETDKPFEDSPTEIPAAGPMYKGESFAVWANRLKHDKSREATRAARNATLAMASPNTAELFKPMIAQQLKLPYSYERIGWVESVMRRIHAELVLPETAALLPTMSDEQRVKAIQLFEGDSVPLKVPPEEMRKWINWCELQFQTSQSAELRDAIVSANLYFVNHNTPLREQTIESSANRTRIVVMLESIPEAAKSGKWLETPAYVDYQFSQMFHQSVARRAVAAYGDTQLPLEPNAQAGCVLYSLLKQGYKPKPQELQVLLEAVRKQLTATATELEQCYELVELKHDIPAGITALLPKIELAWERRREPAITPTLLALSLANVLSPNELLHDELTLLHKQLEKTALAGIFVNEKKWEKGNWEKLPQPVLLDRQRWLRQVTFLQTGLLLGVSKDDLLARFDKKLPVDVDAKVALCIEELEKFHSLPIKNRADVIGRLVKYAERRHCDQLAHVLAAVCSAVDNDERGALGLDVRPLIGALVRLAGDSLLDRITQILESSDSASQGMLLDNCKEIRFVSLPVNRVEKFSVWVTQTLSDENVSPKIMESIGNLVLRLLGDEVDAEPNLQRAASQTVLAKAYVAGLGTKYDKSLYRHPAEYNLGVKDIWRHYSVQDSLALLQVKLEHLVTEYERLTTDPATEVVVLMWLRTAIHREAVLDDSQSKRLQTYFAARLQSEASVSSLEVVAPRDNHSAWPIAYVPGITDVYYGTGNSWGSNQRRVSSLTQILSIVLVLGWEDALHEEIEALSRKTGGKPSQTWRSKNTHDQYGLKASTSVLVIHLQCRALLGDDPLEVIKEHERVRLDLLDKKERLIGPGDVLAIYIPGILPRDSVDPPLLQAGTNAPVAGYPIVVSAEGNIIVGRFGEIAAKGLECLELKQRLMDKIDGGVGTDDRPQVQVDFLLRSGEKKEIRNVTGSSTAK